MLLLYSSSLFLFPTFCGITFIHNFIYNYLRYNILYNYYFNFMSFKETDKRKEIKDTVNNFCHISLITSGSLHLFLRLQVKIWSHFLSPVCTLLLLITSLELMYYIFIY